MGKLFRDAGYETAYFGKWHIPMSEEQTTFTALTHLSAETRFSIPRLLPRSWSNPTIGPFLPSPRFLALTRSASGRENKRFPASSSPNRLPWTNGRRCRANFDPPENETDLIAHMRKSYQAHRLFPVGDYTEDDWRRLIWGYYRLIERVDGYIGDCAAGAAAIGARREHRGRLYKRPRRLPRRAPLEPKDRLLRRNRPGPLDRELEGPDAGRHLGRAAQQRAWT